MKNIWFKLHGYPGLLISDQEGGIGQDTATAAHLEEKGCKVLLRAKGQHANLVERHHELATQWSSILGWYCRAPFVTFQTIWIVSQPISIFLQPISIFLQPI
jgi:hypothetical protein